VLAVFDEVLQASPSTEMLLMKASYMDLLKMPKDSINKVLQQALLIEPDNVSARLQLVQNIWNQQDYPRVIALSQAGQEYNPDEMLFYYFEGFAHFQQDDRNQALEVFRKGTAQITDDSNPEIVSDFYGMMGDILHEKGQAEEAFAAYDSCLQWKPDNIGALNNYAYYLSLQNRDLKRAEQMSLKTVQAEPSNSTYLDTYAWILFMEERYDEAKEYIDQALANDAEVSAVIVEHAGDIYAQCGDIPKAMEYWLKAKERGSDSTTIDRKIKEKKYIKEP
jgi:tetratricopeptide (TPR) repeat protein